MSRSGYSDGLDNWERIKWRGQVASVIRGKKGQAFLRELVSALGAMPARRLIANELQAINGDVCALGALGVQRNVDMSGLDPDEYDELAAVFGVRHQLIQEIEAENDDEWVRRTPEERWTHMHEWATGHLNGGASADASTKAIDDEHEHEA